MRVKVSVVIDKEVYEKSHALGVNVSKACENYLKMLNATIEGANNPNKGFLAPDSFTKEAGVRSPGFEPGSSAWEASSWQGTAEDWNLFREHLKKQKYNRTWESTLFNYAQQYGDCLFKHDFSRIQALPKSQSSNVVKSLAALAKFTGRYREFQQLREDYAVGWGGRSKTDVFIDRMTSTENSEEIWSWIRQVKEARPELADLMDLMTVSGLRFVEGVSSFNLIAELTRTGKLILDRDGNNYRGGYYNRELSSLEHFWFRDLFLRKTKKAFVSFVPQTLLDQIGKAEKLNTDQVQHLVRRQDLKSRFSDIREAHATFMTKYLKTPEIDFLHGRVTSSVFMANYFNPSLIGDLKARAFQGIAEIQEKVKV